MMVYAFHAIAAAVTPIIEDITGPMVVSSFVMTTLRAVPSRSSAS